MSAISVTSKLQYVSCLDAHLAYTHHTTPLTTNEHLHISDRQTAKVIASTTRQLQNPRFLPTMLCLVKREERAEISTPPYSMSGNNNGEGGDMSV